MPYIQRRPESVGGGPFKLVSDYQPAGDQPEAIRQLIAGVNEGERNQVLLGVTGSGKTFTMANVIARVNRPTLVMAPNKTLAAQLWSEIKTFFPDNAVEYFVSYYDYYQPEAYVPSTDTFIEKDATINEQIDRMRHSATRAARAQRRDHRRLGVVHLRPRPLEKYTSMTFRLRGQKDHRPHDSVLRRLVDSSTSATITIFIAGPSASAATPSKCSRPTRSRPSASRFSAMRSRIDRRVRTVDRQGARQADRGIASTPDNHY